MASSALRAAAPLRAPAQQQRLSIADYFSSPAPRGTAVAAHCFGASAGRKRASLLAPASASAEPSAEAADEEELDAVAVPPSSVKRARTSRGARLWCLPPALLPSEPALCLAAAAVCDAVAGMLHGIFGGAEPTPSRAGALSVYADAPPGSVSALSPALEEASPAKPHPMARAWVASAASHPLPRPLQPLGNLSKRLDRAAEAPASCAPKARVSSRFFAASPPPALAAPVLEAVDAEPAADADAAPSPAMGADVRHCAAFAATAAAALDLFRHGGGSARKPAGAKRARGAAAATPMRRAHAEADASPAAAASLDAFRFTPRDCRAI